MEEYQTYCDMQQSLLQPPEGDPCNWPTTLGEPTPEELEALKKYYKPDYSHIAPIRIGDVNARFKNALSEKSSQE